MLVTDSWQSGNCWLHRASDLGKRHNPEEALRDSIHPHHSGTSNDGRGDICHLWSDCLLGCATRIKDTKVPLGSS